MARTERGGAHEPLRVLHVVEAFGGGVFEVVRTLAQSLGEAGDTVAIAYGRRPETPAAVRDFVAPEVELHPLPWERRSVRAHFEAARALRALIRKWKPDVVHLHSSFAGVIGALTLPRGIPSIYTPHGYSFTMLDQGRLRRAAFRAIERLTASRVTLVGAVSEAEASVAREVGRPSKVVVVRNGIPELDDPEEREARPSTEKPKAITLGRITAQHLPAETARILAAVSDLADVAWVGGGGRGDVPATVVTNLGVPVTGWMDREEAQRLLRSATACLHWTAWDGQPLSILEALANDVVVVARDIPATREMVGPEQVCDSEEAGVRLLRRVLSDSDLRQSLLLSQRRRRHLYSSRRMASEWREVYAQVALQPAARDSSSFDRGRGKMNLSDRPGHAPFGRSSHP